MKETISYSEIKIQGVLNAEIFEKTPKNELAEFVKNDVEKRAEKFVSKDWTEQVNIQAEYVVIDCRYNVRKTVTARLVFAHGVGAALVGDVVEITR